MHGSSRLKNCPGSYSATGRTSVPRSPAGSASVQRGNATAATNPASFEYWTSTATITRAAHRLRSRARSQLLEFAGVIDGRRILAAAGKVARVVVHAVVG